MIVSTTTIVNKAGMHARPASIFVQKASSFKSRIQIQAKGKAVDAKSILMIMSMGLTRGTEIEIIADGSDEEEAVITLTKLIDDGFGEEIVLDREKREVSKNYVYQRFGDKFRRVGD